MTSRWTNENRKMLTDMYKSGKTIEQIAKKLNRSPNAVRMRLETIVYKNIEEKISPENIASMLNKSVDEILQLFYAHKRFRESKNQSVIDINLSNKNNPIFSNKKNNDILDKIEYENRIMEAVIKNINMKKNIKQILTKNKLPDLFIPELKKILKL